MLSTSSHVFSELYVHLNWHTKNDLPMLDLKLEPVLFEYIRNYCEKCKGIGFRGIGGTSDHIHLLIQFEPFICLADWVGKIKGGSSHEMNENFGSDRLQWQRGYGEVSFAKHDMPRLLGYVENQKEHHRKAKVNRTLELFGTYMENEPQQDLI